MKTSKFIFIFFIVFIFSYSLLYSQGTIENPIMYYEAIKQIWSMYNTYKSIGNFISPGPSFEDIIAEINKAKEQILNEINEGDAEEQIRKAHGYIHNFDLWLQYRDPVIWDWLKENGLPVKDQLEPLITDETPYIAYLTCTTYNLFIPTWAFVCAQAGYTTFEDKAIGDAIEINKKLLGPSEATFTDQYFNLPFYHYNMGKLWEYYNVEAHTHPGSLNRDSYDRVMDFVWESNEGLRKQKFPGYTDFIQSWFIFGDARFVGSYLFVRNEIGEVAIGNPQNIDTARWKFEFLGYRYVNIIHWSGKYLDANCCNNEENSIVRVSSKNNSALQKWELDWNDWYYANPYGTFWLEGSIQDYSGDFPDNVIYSDCHGLARFRNSDGQLIYDRDCDFYLDPSYSNLNLRIINSEIIYVSINNNEYKNGTIFNPWNTVEEGAKWILSGGDVLIAPGNYPENLIINKKCNLMRHGDSGSVIIGKQ